MAKDYYGILGVDKNASKEDIKKAFRKMAHKYHPDKKGGDEAKFKEVNEAYQALSDDQKRAQYDRFGSDFAGAGGHQHGHQHGGFSGFDGFSQGGAWDFSGFQQDGAEFDFGNLNDIFSDFFAGGAGGRSQARRGRDISTEIQISFSDAIFGSNRKILITKTSNCSVCSGSGAKANSKFDTCKKCNGQGKIHEAKRSFLGVISTAKLCEECLGTGQVPHEKCDKCRGAGVMRQEEEIAIVIPAGIRDGEMIRMSGRGEAVARGTTGDLYIKINVAPHPVFRREGNDLAMTLNLKLTDALLGAEHSIETLDGEVKIVVPEGVVVNEILRVKSKGVPYAKGKRGDLLIKLNIKMPSKLSKKSRELIEELKKEGV